MNLKEFRQKLRISKRVVSEHLNIPLTTYANYESGHCDPSINTLVKLADFFNVSIDELVGRTTNSLNLNLIDNTRKNLIFDILNSSNLDVEKLDAFNKGMKSNK